MAKKWIIGLIIGVLSVSVTLGGEGKISNPDEEFALKRLMEASNLYHENSNNNNRNNVMGHLGSEETKSEDQDVNNNSLYIDEMIMVESGKKDFQEDDKTRGKENTSAGKAMPSTSPKNFQDSENLEKSKKLKMTPEELNKKLMEISMRHFNILNMIWKEKFQTNRVKVKSFENNRYFDALASGLIGRR